MRIFGLRIQWIALLLAIAASAGLTFACKEGSRKRACEPVTGVGCKGSRVCAVAFDGTPTCYASAGSLSEGELCNAPDACGKGLGCVRLFGVPRCVRFCDPNATNDACRQSGIVESSLLLENAMSGHCAASLYERSDIGVCVVSCSQGSCPEGSHCGEVVGWREKVGISDSQLDQFTREVEDGQSCGERVVCKEGSACVVLGDGTICRRLAESGCSEGEESIEAVLAGSTRDAGLSDEDAEAAAEETTVTVCKSCDPIGISSSEGEFLLCPAKQMASKACTEGVLARLTAGGAQYLPDQLGEVTEAWTEAFLQDGAFFWKNGEQVDDELWAPGEPAPDLNCAFWSRDGLVAADCAQEMPGLCILAPVQTE